MKSVMENDTMKNVMELNLHDNKGVEFKAEEKSSRLA